MRGYTTRPTWAQIAASIRAFGWTNPILVDGENGVIAGHGRLLAVRKLGMATVAPQAQEVSIKTAAEMTDAELEARDPGTRLAHGRPLIDLKPG